MPPPRARALSRECYACDVRLFLGRLWDHSKDSCMSLFHPFANCETDGTKTVALVCESQLSRCRPSTRFRLPPSSRQVGWTPPASGQAALQAHESKGGCAAVRGDVKPLPTMRSSHASPIEP